MKYLTQKNSQLIADRIVLLINLASSSALIPFSIVIYFRSILSWTIINYTLLICFISCVFIRMPITKVNNTIRTYTETEKPSLTSLYMFLITVPVHLIGMWIASGLILASHFWPNDILIPHHTWFIWSQSTTWFSLLIVGLNLYNEIKEDKNKRKALREAEKKDPHKAQKPGEKN